MARWETKLWPLDRFAVLADRLIAQFHVAVFFTGDGTDSPWVDKIRSQMHFSSANLAGRTSLVELAALYREMAGVISTDTGPMHIAAAVGTPVVALFGPHGAMAYGSLRRWPQSGSGGHAVHSLLQTFMRHRSVHEGDNRRTGLSRHCRFAGGQIETGQWDMIT